MISLYTGEFTVSPIPLELSLNYCSHSCAFCSRVDQPITLADLRVIPAGDVKVGDELFGWDRSEEPSGERHRPGVRESRYRVWRKTRVTHTFRRIAPTVRIDLKNGESVVCTPDHHWYTGRSGALEYKPASMRKGRNLHRLDLPLLPAAPFSEEYMIGYCRGLLEGDGAWMPQGAWRIALTDPEPLARLASFLLLLGVGHFDARPYGSPEKPEHRQSQQIYIPPGSPAISLINGFDHNDAEYWRGWLGGIYDAEGNTPAKLDREAPEALRIAQYKSVNPLTYQKIERALRGFNFGTVAEEHGVRVVGGRLTSARFTQLVQPSIERKKNPLLGSTLKGIQHPHGIERIVPLGDAEVASFETTTHNYISGGFMSRNCFANINNRERTADVPALMRQIAGFRDRRSPEALLLKQGYPVLISNRVDPFAHSNSAVALPVMEMMTDLGIPLTFQTRGGRGTAEALRFLRPAVWYVSFAQWRDEGRARLEPGAPTIEERLAFVSALRAAGHRVVAGINPYVPEWLPPGDDVALLDALRERGVEGLWIELLHLTPKQGKAMTARERDAVGLPLLARVGGRRPPTEDVAALRALRAMARDKGFTVYTSGQPEATDFWAPYRETYPRLFPTTQDAVDACWVDVPDGTALSFDAFMAAFLSRYDLPDVAGGLDTYVRAKASGGRLLPELLNSGRLRSGMGWAEVMGLIFEEPRVSLCPARLRCFSYAGERAGDGEWTQYRDENDLPYLVFNRAETDEYFSEPLTVMNEAP